jgi:hypothetical protein
MTAVLALVCSAGATPLRSGAAALPAAVANPIISIQCTWSGWDWSGAALVGALQPGRLAVGSYYDSAHYGYSGYPKYYGDPTPYPGCVYPVYSYGPVRKRYRHRATGLR